MKARIVVTEDGKISVFTDDGTLAEGKQAIELLFKALEAAGITPDEVGKVEQHRHEHEHVAEHAHTH